MDTRTLTIFLISTGFSVLSDLTLSFCPRPLRQLPQIYIFNQLMGHRPSKSSLLHLQQPTAGPQPAPHKSRPHLPTFFFYFFKIHFSIIFLYAHLPNTFFPSAFPNNFIFSYHVFCAYYLPCPCHLS